MHDVLPPEMFDFMASPGTEWDAPVVGERFRVPPVPGPDVYDLRARRAGKPTCSARQVRIGSSRRLGRTRRLEPLSGGSGRVGLAVWDLGVRSERSRRQQQLGRVRTPDADGAPLVANDMHLAVRVPNTWYRAQLEWPDCDRSPGRRAASAGRRHASRRRRRSSSAATPSSPGASPTPTRTGATSSCSRSIPAIRPAIGRPTAGETFERVRRGASRLPAKPSRSRAGHVDDLGTGAGAGSSRPAARLPLGRAFGRAARRGRHSARDARGRSSEAFDEANGLGTPGQNIVVADRDGHIGWSVYGSIPRRVGHRRPAARRRGPTARAAGTAGWTTRSIRAWSIRPAGASGPPTPASSTATMLAKLGDGSYEVGSRATIIRDRLDGAGAVHGRGHARHPAGQPAPCSSAAGAT